MPTTDEPKAPVSAASPSSQDVLRQLQLAYPRAFTTPPTPLQVGIHRSIFKSRPTTLDGLSNRAIYKGLGIWTQQEAYLEAVRNRTRRINLDGRPVGDVSDKAVAFATQRLQSLKIG